MKSLIAASLALMTAASASAQDLEVGGGLFYSFCAACHGDDATGGGPMTEVLNEVPPDLTTLAARNGGVFPRVSVVYRIDGREELPGHGGPMPIFGDIFAENLVPMKSESGQPILAGQAIADIIAWMEMIQQ